MTNPFQSDENNNYESYGIGARLDNLSRIPLKKSIIIAISLSSFFALYDVSNFQYISPILKSGWHLSDAQIAYSISMRILGQVIGAFCISIFADWYGRKPALVLTLLILAAGSILTAISTDIMQVSIFRLLTGIGIGGEVVIAAAYIGEVSPKSKRGKYTSLIFLMGAIGIASSGPVSYVLLMHDKIVGMDSWRVLTAFPAIVALLLLAIRADMSESPRWLLSKGRIKETNTMLVKLGLTPIQDLKIPSPSAKRRDLLHASRDLKILSRSAFFVSLWFLVLASGGAATLLVVEYVNQGYTVSQSVAITTVGTVGYIVGASLSILVADRFERKYQFAIAAMIMGLAFVLRGVFIHDYFALFVVGFIGFASNSWILACLFTYTAENFPTRIRSMASGAVEGI
jgi:putative MFS transporter